MAFMFANCESLVEVKIGNNFSIVTDKDMTKMFDGCNSILTKTNIVYPKDDEGEADNASNKEFKAIEIIIEYLKRGTNAK